MTHLATLAALGQSRRGLAMLPPVHAVYQPIVDLVSGATVAYEALARGPRGTEWELPESLFADARRHGVEAALDWECRAAAISGALRRRLPSSVPLFVNAAGAWLGTGCPAHLTGLVEAGGQRLQLVVEIAERTLVQDPARALAAGAQLRDGGYGLALDDVSDPASLELLPLLEPDVIKLDLVLLSRRAEAEARTVTEGVPAHAQRTGAIVLAERIETGGDLERAGELGARLGQGWALGRPGPLPAEPVAAHHDLSFTRAGSA